MRQGQLLTSAALRTLALMTLNGTSASPCRSRRRHNGKGPLQLAPKVAGAAKPLSAASAVVALTS
jgi:hypothetical protein